MPAIYAYVRLAMGPVVGSRLAEADRSGRSPPMAPTFERQQVKPIDISPIAVQTLCAPSSTALARWQGAGGRGGDSRAITANDTLEENLALVRAAAPASTGSAASGYMGRPIVMLKSVVALRALAVSSTSRDVQVPLRFRSSVASPPPVRGPSTSVRRVAIVSTGESRFAVVDTAPSRAAR